MITYRLPLAVLILAVTFTPSACINCYRNMTGDPESCPTTGEIADKVQTGLAGVWKFVKDTVQDVSGNDFIDKFGQQIADATGIDITSHEKNKAWVQSTMKKIGVDFDVSGNCYVTYDKATEETLERGCGAVGAAGKIGAEVMKWMQGKKFNFWANSVCFTMPGNAEREVCMCSKDGCNMDRAAARAAVGINPGSRSAICNGEECPMADLSKIDESYDFNSACYTGGEDSIVKCFTSDIPFVPEAAALTRSRRSTDGYELLNIDGENNGSSDFKLNSAGQAKGFQGMLAVILGLAFGIIINI